MLSLMCWCVPTVQSVRMFLCGSYVRGFWKFCREGKDSGHVKEHADTFCRQNTSSAGRVVAMYPVCLFQWTLCKHVAGADSESYINAVALNKVGKASLSVSKGTWAAIGRHTTHVRCLCGAGSKLTSTGTRQKADERICNNLIVVVIVPG